MIQRGDGHEALCVPLKLLSMHELNIFSSMESQFVQVTRSTTAVAGPIVQAVEMQPTYLVSSDLSRHCCGRHSCYYYSDSSWLLESRDVLLQWCLRSAPV